MVNFVGGKIKYVINELHHGNLIPAIVTAAVIWWSYHNLWIPTVEMLEQYGFLTTTAIEGTAEVAIELHRLQMELDEFKKQSRLRASEEPYGKEFDMQIGITHKGWKNGAN